LDAQQAYRIGLIMSNELIGLIEQYGNAEHNQDDGLAVYFLNEIKDKISILEGVAEEYDQLIKHMDAGGDFHEFQSKRQHK
jgi:hypothetical protein